VRRVLAALLAAVPLLGAGAAVAEHRPGPDPDRPSLPGHTIVKVEGDAENGFSVHRLDGSSEHPPTLSESTAECEEYDDPVRVAVCVAEVETSFEGLADVQLSLRWAEAQHPRRR
jgi:hypothetical protein